MRCPCSEQIIINGGEFIIDEISSNGGFSGPYNVENHSNRWYIYGFAVSNPNAQSGSKSSTRANWGGSPGEINFGNGLEWAFRYQTAAGPDYIAPNTSAISQFFFGPGVFSDAGVEVVDTSGTLGQFSSVATPIPAALPLFAGGLGVIGLLARRRNRKATR